ncbi:Transcriptional regulatory protein [Gnomoniopsis smithogilvyi]|uniref:Transcriptional regulatory protein n=1 Tax=Gnomoniopsis smithogilvyi TaxID=1191159 RepID=A0A9W9CYN6_9PEZI|nr:Transcriptional regulatory protein [Gnomoniopsis smithogilvyi]
MATGGTAPPLVMANHSHPLLDQDSTVSSPLSSPQAEGQDIEPDDIDMKSHPSDDEELDKPTLARAESPANATHDESDLSDLETNDSEAETERLYDTPRKNNAQSSTEVTNATSETKLRDKTNRAFQRSPSKLQEQLQAGVEADFGDDDHDDSLQSKRIQSDDDKIVKKRKRSMLLQDQADANEPARKRSGSVLEANDETSSLSKPAESTGEKSAEHSGDEEDSEAPAIRSADDVVKIEPVRSRSKRNTTKKRKGLEEDLAQEVAEETEEHIVEEERPVEDEPVATAEIDEEARHEEEMERKRHAFGQLSSIEKNFAILRDRLYEERLKELNEEEALLTSDNPTHPEYLAMMECIDSRRDDRLRISEIEFKFDMDALNRWAVARRAQILSQYYQSVRESRERTMDELGKQWYEIQHERRKNANPIPDYGFRFPKDKAQQKKQAIAHNKETSILAGIAQHHGFPAAPEMKPASQAEVEDDFEAMHRARQSIMGPAQHVQPALNDYGAVPFGRNLGPAGEQFLEQTPWANPKHPSHHVGSRRHSQGAYAGPPAFINQAKSAPQQSGPAWLANGQPNGESAYKHPAAVADQEIGPGRKTAEPAKAMREAVVL